MVEAINQALMQEMERDKDVVILGEDVGKNGGVFRVTEGLWKKFGDERVIDTPLAESGIVGTAIGMAIYGLKPVAEIQFDGFLPPAFDQLVNHATRIRARSRGRFKAHITVRVPYGGGIRALEHHSDSPEAYYAHMPGIKVVIPSTPYNAKGLLISSIRDPDPVIYFEPKRVYRAIKEDVPEESYAIPLGKARLLREGDDVTVISWGAMLKDVQDGVNLLKDVSVEIIDLQTLFPYDLDTVMKSAKKTGRIVIVHEAPKTCGFGAELAAAINERELLELEAPITRVTGFDTVVPLPKLEKYYYPDANRIAKAIKKVAEF